MNRKILSVVLPLGIAVLVGLSAASYAAQPVEGMTDRTSGYYENRELQVTPDVESVVPPPSGSDVRSESINRTRTPHLDHYIEKNQGNPTEMNGR